MKSIIKKSSFICVLFFLNACSESFLELTPLDSPTEAAFYQDEADFDAAIIGVYHNWRLMTQLGLFRTEFRTDNLSGIATPDLEISTNADGQDIAYDWWFFYPRVIHPSNLILDRIDNIEDSDTKDRIRGEALFFRAYSYYWLNLIFGGVPKIITETFPEDAINIGRSTEEEIWSQVETDLQEASNLLGDTPIQYGRMDKYDALTFLAKAYVQQNKWAEARDVLADVFTNSGHGIEPDNWATLWTLEAEGTNPELMLAGVFDQAANNNLFGVQYNSAPNDGQAQGRFEYKPDALTFWETGDLRKDETVGLFDQTGPTNFAGFFFENRKYDFGRVGNDWTCDMVVLRFTDVQLLYAEAISMSAGSPQQQSLDLINPIRQRAGLTDLELSDISSLADFVEIILRERRAEFFFEGQRFADLKRHNKLIEKLSAFGARFTFDQNYRLLPIPQVEIQRAASGVLTQNPGY